MRGPSWSVGLAWPRARSLSDSERGFGFPSEDAKGLRAFGRGAGEEEAGAGLVGRVDGRGRLPLSCETIELKVAGQGSGRDPLRDISEMMTWRSRTSRERVSTVGGPGGVSRVIPNVARLLTRRSTRIRESEMEVASRIRSIMFQSWDSGKIRWGVAWIGESSSDSTARSCAEDDSKSIPWESSLGIGMDEPTFVVVGVSVGVGFRRGLRRRMVGLPNGS